MASAELLKMNLLNVLHTTWYTSINYTSREGCFNDSWNFPSPSPSCFSSRQNPSRVKKNEHMAKSITVVLIAFNFCPWACLNAICDAPSLFPARTTEMEHVHRLKLKEIQSKRGCMCQGPGNTLWKHHDS